MIGKTTSLKPALSIISTKRVSICRRRAASRIRRARTPVGYLSLVAINKKPLLPVGEEVVFQQATFASGAPLPIGAREAPLHHVVMMMVQAVSGTNQHR